MGDVVNILDNKPHLAGSAKCIVCKHTWTAVAPVGTVNLHCPNCETLRGVWEGPLLPKERFVCTNCECDYFVITRKAILCAHCVNEVKPYD